jgi:hypothetical protein
MRDRRRELHDFELEPEVRDWLDSLSDSDFKRADEVSSSRRKAPNSAARGQIISRARSGSCGSGFAMLRPG